MGGMTQNPIEALFEKAKGLGASDVHIVVGAPVLFRVNGQLLPQTDKPVTRAQAEQFADLVLGDLNKKRFQKDLQVDVSYALADGTRLRVNCASEREHPTIVARLIADTIPTLEELELTEIADQIRAMRQGLVLFTGPTGSGKSTSLASIIAAIQKDRPINLITLEDPIEYVFKQDAGCVRQREYLRDFLTFAEGLRVVLRQDPDVIMVGEMRDMDTIAAAITLAETGHLVFATLHTPNTIQTVDRIVDVFPPHQQPQVRTQISMSLRMIVAQRLVPKVEGGRLALREVLVMTPAIANIIRDNRPQELKTVLQTNEEQGMHTFEKEAKRLYSEGKISKEVYEFVLLSL